MNRRRAEKPNGGKAERWDLHMDRTAHTEQSKGGGTSKATGM